MKKYRLNSDRFEHKAGTIVQKVGNYDYGLAADDTRATGIEHILVSLDGDYPFFTVAVSELEDV